MATPRRFPTLVHLEQREGTLFTVLGNLTKRPYWFHIEYLKSPKTVRLEAWLVEAIFGRGAEYIPHVECVSQTLLHVNQWDPEGEAEIFIFGRPDYQKDVSKMIMNLADYHRQLRAQRTELGKLGGTLGLPWGSLGGILMLPGCHWVAVSSSFWSIQEKDSFLQRDLQGQVDPVLSCSGPQPPAHTDESFCGKSSEKAPAQDAVTQRTLDAPREAATQESPKAAREEAATQGSPKAAREAATQGSPKAAREAATQGSPRAAREAATQESPRATREAATQGSPRATREAATQGSPRATREAATQGSPRATREAATQGSPRATREAATQRSPRATREAATQASPGAVAREAATQASPGAVAREAATQRSPGAVAREAATQASPGAVAREAATQRSPCAVAREAATQRSPDATQGVVTGL
uniref:KH domain-containing protein 3 n=1 Tax=Nyctereutes procyonoides TaxID=34880 RepID=UPI00244453FD|nr:KH domain-containing protein 3 [Nyctereutes procyonoides]